jgi:hypothetical protein
VITPEDNSTFQSIRAAHKRLRRVVLERNRQINDQSRRIREAAERERQIRVQIQTLPEPAVKAYVDVIRRRGDLSMAQALSLVSEVFTSDE